MVVSTLVGIVISMTGRLAGMPSTFKTWLERRRGRKRVERGKIQIMIGMRWRKFQIYEKEK